MRVSEPVEPAAAGAAGGQSAVMEVKAGGAAPQADVGQPQPMEVSPEQRGTTGAASSRNTIDAKQC